MDSGKTGVKLRIYLHPPGKYYFRNRFFNFIRIHNSSARTKQLKVQ